MITGNAFVTKKSQEISLALIKLSVRCRRQEFRQRLERLAFDITEYAGSGNMELAIISLSTASHMVSFGRTIYEIEPMSAVAVNEQVDALLAEAQRIIEPLGSSEDITDIFSDIKPAANQIESVKKPSTSFPGPVSVPKKRSARPLVLQPAIISAIRQLGSPAMKDLVAALPNTSERTLRYNLSRMTELGLVVKSGNGPSCRYSLPDNHPINNSMTIAENVENIGSEPARLEA